MEAEACLDDARAMAFAAGELPAPDRESVETHIDDCDSCRQVIAALVRAEAPTDWAPGIRVGRYVVRSKIGRGGMGSVWRAEDIELHRPVALKRLHARADRDDRARLVREARAAAQLSHPNVVAVYEVGEADGEPFLAMELVDGETLSTWLKAQPRTWREIAAVLAQAGRGLASAHACGLVHRDFKPDNVLVDRAGRARVVDFGLAKPQGHFSSATRGLKSSVRAALDTGITETGAISGTPAYLAPELVDGALSNARSDQYAFAITCFQALHGEHPFKGGTAEAIWTEMAAGRVRDGAGDVPAWLDRHVRRGLAIKPSERWGSVAEFVEAIEHRPRRWGRWIAGGVILVAANIAAFMVMHSPAGNCGGSLVDNVWNSAVRQAQARAFAGVAPHRDGAIAEAGRLTDDWADAWRLGHEAACHADPAPRAARLACLDRELGELRAQLVAWGTPDAALVDTAVAALAALPRPEACAAPPPVGHAPLDLEQRVDAFVALVRAGKHHKARPLAPPLIAAAEGAGDSLLLARVLVAAGAVERTAGDLERARELDARAAREAGRAGDDALTFDALLQEAEVVIDQDRGVEALGLADAADALDQRANLGREDRVLVARADALGHVGRTPEAIAAYDQAIAILEPRAARDRAARLHLAAAIGARGSMLGWQDKREEALAALQRCLSIEQAELGADDPEVGRTLHDLALQELNLGRIDQAVAHYQRARAIFVEAFGTDHDEVAATDMALGDVERERGHCKEAREIYERARTESRAKMSGMLAGIEMGLAQCARDENDDQGAAEHWARAIAIHKETGVRGIGLADAEEEYALALEQTGHDREARVQAEAALAEYAKAGVAPLAQTDAWRVLAEIETHEGHREKAIELLKKVVAATEGQTRPDIVVAHDDAAKQLRVLSK